jgi:hypothetical protein
MKTITRFNLFFLLLILTTSCLPWKKTTTPASEVKPLSDTVRIREGSTVYALPMTVFTVKVELERTIEIPGPYAKYADDLLGLNKVILTRTEHWSVRGISVNSHEEIDPSEYYVIEAPGSFQTNILALKREGLILDLNPAQNTQGVDYLKDREMNTNRFMSYDLGSDEYYQVQTDTAFRRIRVDSSFIRIPYIVEKKKKLTDDQLAERAARRIMDLREGKILILTGEANVFPQSNAAIDEINRMEQEYTQLFTGKSITESITYSYQFIPRKDMTTGTFTLFKFSDAAGPAKSSSGNGTPVTVEIIPEQKTKDLTVITREQPEPAARKIDKLYYRMPDVVTLKINLGNEPLYSSRKLVYQLGEIMQLPANYVLGK